MTIKVDTSDVIPRLDDLARSLEDPRPYMQIIAEELYRVARASFETESDPDGTPWLPLSLRYATWKAKAFPGRGILRRRGQLIRSLRRGVEGRVAFSTAGPLAHAAIHQFGGQAGRGRKVAIPARPYLGFPADSQERVVEDIEESIRERFDSGA